eukprot:TRINITY_DN11061_c0_g2_i3.p2 TRINITY_DN11061_c0_g2~~TRINITY_DN11061_c0_g2_i3.p2  ORF type:complete len:113 (+),score=4.45 TRINITY_DN11061_c0_g2_i3:227-565(+)
MLSSTCSFSYPTDSGSVFQTEMRSHHHTGFSRCSSHGLSTHDGAELGSCYCVCRDIPLTLLLTEGYEGSPVSRLCLHVLPIVLEVVAELAHDGCHDRRIALQVHVLALRMVN